MLGVCERLTPTDGEGVSLTCLRGRGACVSGHAAGHGRENATELPFCDPVGLEACGGVTQPANHMGGVGTTERLCEAPGGLFGTEPEGLWDRSKVYPRAPPPGTPGGPCGEGDITEGWSTPPQGP